MAEDLLKVEKAVRDILLNDWDPIGVKNNPNAKAEYDGYALRVTGMLLNGSDESKLTEYLNKVVSEDLELPVNEAVAKVVAKKLVALGLEQQQKK
ncbi:MAG TPA: hypothetical protein VF412_00125 [Bdellovibrio sp.]|uniref:hypothetical protein n=1 Tax=Bdellovibrio sp. TaxID=28201 RepID=UPI002F135F18